jgi:hypothetical protein
MSAQYLRQFSLIVSPPSGDGIELGALRCTFEIRRGDTQTPNSADITIYNLSDNTANTICSPEFTQVQVKAGYGTSANLGLIFKGSIKQARKGREDQKDSYVAITAADGDEAYNFASIALTLAAGAATPANFIQEAIANMARAALASPTGKPGGQAITQGYIPPLKGEALPRGRTYFGCVSDELREIAMENDSKWSIQDGALCLIPNTGYIISGDPILITPTTGLIGVPEQTQNGLEIRTLLNSSLKIGQRIQLDSKNINQYRYGLDTNSVAQNLFLKEVLSTSADGIYYIMRASHSGDTRGNDWYTDLVCLSVDAAVSESAVQQGSITPANAVPRY